MHRLVAGMLILPALVLIVGVGGCGKEDPPKVAKRPPLVDGSGKGDGAAAAKPKISPGKAKVTGKVVLTGEKPNLPSLEAVMAKHGDHKTCLMGEKVDQTWTVSKDGGVANAVVWLSPPDDKEFEVVKTDRDETIDQPFCVYTPHVLVLRPGQKLIVKNSASVVHNTLLTLDGLANPRGFGKTIEPGKSDTVDWLNPQDTVVTIGCQFHTWMSAKMWILPHQYAAVTKDDGSFTIDNVPAGVELSVVGWHESPGFFYGGKKGTKKTFKDGDNNLGNLEIKAP